MNQTSAASRLHNPVAHVGKIGGVTRAATSHSCQAHLFTPKQAAVYCGVSVWTVYRWIAQGVGPAYIRYPGTRRLYFSKDALDAFIARNTRGATKGSA